MTLNYTYNLLIHMDNDYLQYDMDDCHYFKRKPKKKKKKNTLENDT